MRSSTNDGFQYKNQNYPYFEDKWKGIYMETYFVEKENVWFNEEPVLIDRLVAYVISAISAI